ncbi:hypothetical protein N7528_004777 [Penicillium herquei]|nr:hypothetical protein N7528_004777 [Penicillium herquei]
MKVLALIKLFVLFFALPQWGGGSNAGVRALRLFVDYSGIGCGHVRGDDRQLSVLCGGCKLERKG